MENQVDPGPSKPEPEPRIIGLTGGIGSGKTTLAKHIEECGYPVYFSDDKAKEIVNTNTALKAQIIALLGNDAYDASGRYNRAFVADKVFNNAELLTSLNSLIHPAVKVDFEQWVQSQSSPIVFKETALLFELGHQTSCFKSVLVTADDNIRMKRVMDRDGKTYREVEKIMQKQMPEKDKIRKADFVIYNNGTTSQLETETAVLLSQLKKHLQLV